MRFWIGYRGIAGTAVSLRCDWLRFRLGGFGGLASGSSSDKLGGCGERRASIRGGRCTRSAGWKR